MDDIQKALIETFRSETSELLGELEDALLELEENPDDREMVDRVFRALHTIKGNGSMFGFDQISRFTHDIENIFELVRDGVITIDRNLIDLTLTEFWLLHSLARIPGHVKSHDQLMEAANVVVTNNAITAHIRRIRDKFRDVDPTFDSIRTEYGMGYRWLAE